MKNKPKPDNRKDNVDRIQKNINMTIHNMELGSDMIEKTSDYKMKKSLEEKNERRKQALKGLRHEIQDEARNQEKDY